MNKTNQSMFVLEENKDEISCDNRYLEFQIPKFNRINPKSKAYYLLSYQVVKDAISSEFNVSIEDLESACSDEITVKARAFAMYLCNTLIPFASISGIARQFNKDSSIVCEALKQFKDELNNESADDIKHTFFNLIQRLNQNSLLLMNS